MDEVEQQSSGAGFVRNGRPTFMGCLAAFFVLLAVVVGGGLLIIDSRLTPAKVEPKPLFDPQIVARVSAEQAVKGQMNDPGSYSYVSHSIRKVQIAEGVEGWKVALVFRGANAFGGKVVSSAEVTTDASGLNVLSIE